MPSPYIEEIVNQIALLVQQGKRQQALAVAQQALDAHPTDIRLLGNSGSLAMSLGHYEVAERAFLKISQLYQDNDHALLNLGQIYKFTQRLDKAEKVLRRLLDIRPGSADAALLLGSVYRELGRLDEAENMFRQAIDSAPGNAAVLYNFGVFLQKVERFDDAIDAFKGTLAINPRIVEAHTNLGMLFKNKKLYEEAERACRAALAIDQNHGFANWNLSHLLLNRCEFNEGWQRYEARYFLDDEFMRAMGTVQPSISANLYRGEDLKGKHLFIWPEQGIGDEVMFSSVIPDLESTGADVSVACDTRLVKIYKRSFPFVKVVPKDTSNQYRHIDTQDYHMAIGSLSHHFRHSLSDYEKSSAYFRVDADLLEKWYLRYEGLQYDFTVGISWRGGNDDKLKQRRSIDLIDLSGIIEQPVNVVSLQYGDHRAEIDNFHARTGNRINDWDDADPLTDLDNFIAQIKALDLVISVDNSTVHFAGAVGCKTYVMLPTMQEYRWTESRNDSYWYPDVMTLFRKAGDSDWRSVISDVAKSLKSLLANAG